MRAMILAAGEGKRLQPLTFKNPKPMLKILGKPIIYYQLKLLKRYNVKEVIINLSYMPWKIKDYLGNKKLGISIRYSYEKKLLGTAGGLKKVENFFDEDFFIIYGDVITNLNLNEVYRFHKKKNGVGAVCLHKVPRDEPSSSIIVLNKDNMIKKFIEKPKRDFSESIKGNFKLVNSGVYVLKPSIFDYIPKNKFSDFALDIFPKLIREKEKLFGYVHTNPFWAEIGKLERYYNIREEFEKHNVKLNL